MKRILSLFSLLAIAAAALAQPLNDDCAGIVNLGKAPFCDMTVFDNIGATASMIGNDNLPVSPSCLGIGQPQNDVWFQFTAADTITDYRITVTGINTPMMVNPLIILYRGDCQFDGLAEAGCSAPAPGAMETVLDIVGLTPGLDYFIRISDYGGAATEGNFTLCIQEIPPVTDITQGGSQLCKGKITDSGGLDNPYGPNEDHTFSICPTDNPACINFTLDWYNLENGSTTLGLGDALQFYDGPNATTSPLIAEISGGPGFGQFVTGGGGVLFSVQATSGCLTLHFKSDADVEFEGFSGHWECSAGACEKKQPIVVNENITNAQIEDFVAEAATQVTITNIACAQGAYGTFLAGDKTDLGLERGLVMTSGQISSTAGPNGTANPSTNNFAPGDADLDVLSPTILSHDACVIEMDVLVKTDQLTFEYVFGSEEYSEYVGFDFNDIFAFLVSGPGLVGDPGLNGQKNIAVLPGTNTQVSVNSVNYLSNWEYWRNNELGQSIQYDGLTSDYLGEKKSITARQAVTPCNTYHLKFAVADRQDFILDSGVFISEIKGGTPTVSLAFLNGVNYLSEYCFGQPDNLIIKLDNPKDVPTSYNVVIGGTATLGVDYNLNIPNVITFQPGVSEITYPIGAILDLLNEGTETITISLTKDFGCGVVNLVTSTINIADQLIVDVVAGDTALVCAGGTLQLEATGATSYFWTPPGAVSNPNIADPTITPTNDILLIVSGTAGTCTDKDSVYVHIINPQIDVAALAPTNICLGGSVALQETDNIDHAGLTWSPVTGLDDPTSANPIVTPTETTTYTATVEIAGCKVSDAVTINVDTLFFPKLTTLDTFICQNYSVDLGENISPSTTIYSWSPALGLSATNVSGPIATPQTTTTYVLTATSDNGFCTQTASVKITVAPADVDINGDPYREICLGDSIQLFANTSGVGTIKWTASTGGSTVKNPFWASPDESTWYTVAFGIGQCTVFDSVYVRVDSLPDQSFTLDPFKSVYCPGEQVLIKSPTYQPADFPGLQPDMGNIMWVPDNNGLLTPDTLWNLLITTNDTITYSRIIHNYGCRDTANITINVFEPVIVNATTSDNYTCPGDLVQLNAIFAGSYGVEWSGGAVSNSKIKNPTANPLGTTTYTVKLQDIPCPASGSVTVTVEPKPDIQMTQDPIVCIGNSIELQHNLDGAITWSWIGPGAFTSTDNNLTLDPAVAGTYSVTATGVNSCTATASTNVTIASATVSLGADQKLCRDLTAYANATVTGTGNGTFLWKDGTTGTQDSVALVANNEVKSLWVTYTYGNNCTASDTVKIKTLPGVDVVDFKITPDSATYCQGAKVTIVENATSPSPLTYAWSLNDVPKDSLSGKSVMLNLSGKGDNKVSVVITTPDGCVGTKAQTFPTDDCFGIPNAFTPDGDGTNEFFEVWYEPGAVTLEGIKVYARWGELVYDDDPDTGHRWDGKINGKDAPMDVYIYKVTIRRPDQTREILTGDVTLIR